MCVCVRLTIHIQGAHRTKVALTDATLSSAPSLLALVSEPVDTRPPMEKLRLEKVDIELKYAADKARLELAGECAEPLASSAEPPEYMVVNAVSVVVASTLATAAAVACEALLLDWPAPGLPALACAGLLGG